MWNYVKKILRSLNKLLFDQTIFNYGNKQSEFIFNYLVSVDKCWCYFDDQKDHIRLASLVGITERESREGRLGWHGKFTRFDRKISIFSFSYFA